MFLIFRILVQLNLDGVYEYLEFVRLMIRNIRNYKGSSCTFLLDGSIQIIKTHISGLGRVHDSLERLEL